MAEMKHQSPHNRAEHPKLRCPACHFMVTLPAETCSRCGANLRTGFVPVSKEQENRYRRGRIILGGMVLFLVTAVAVAFFYLLPPGPAVTPARLPAHPGSDFGDALESFHDLPDQPPGAQPGIILNRAKDTAGQVEEHWEQVDEIYQEK